MASVGRTPPKRSGANSEDNLQKSDPIEKCSNPACDVKEKCNAVCFICKAPWHIKCDPRNPKSRSVQNIQADVQKVAKYGYQFICEGCTSSSSQVFSLLSRLGTAMDSLTSRVIEIESHLSRTNTCEKKGESYADVLISEKQSENVILISSTEREVNKDIVREKIDSSVSPEDFQISEFKSLSNNKVLIKSKGDKIVKLVEDVKDNLGADYDVKVIDKKKPKLKIVGLRNDTDLSEDQIVSAIKAQNIFVKDSDDIKVIKKYPSGKDQSSVTIIIEVDMHLHKLFMQSHYAYIRWNRCHVFDATQVARCYKCSRLSHIEHECRNEICCPNCANNHRLKECKCKELKCINCHEANVKYNLKYDIKHAASDPKCESMLRILKRKLQNLRKQ